MAAIVTGGAQGIGASICVALLKEGYKVCVADIQDVTGKEFVAKQQEIHGFGNVIFSHCDVTKESDYSSTFDLAISVFEKVEVLINNAGIAMEQCSEKMIQVNLIGPIIGCEKALKYMGRSNGGKGGMVINVASLAGLLPYWIKPAYSASKHGVVGLTRSYGFPYYETKEGVIFAALCPSYTNTHLIKTSSENTLIPKVDLSKRTDLLSPEYVAQGVIKLLKDRINGSTLMVTKDKGYEYVECQVKKIQSV